MIQSKQPLSQSIIQLCKSHNIQHIVISPGSRNAPLTIGFTNHDFFECYSIVDERSAGFFALGIAQQLQQPVALVCTSGSALVNYYPAVTEAFYSRIPLVVISADRPEHLSFFLLHNSDSDKKWAPRECDSRVVISWRSIPVRSQIDPAPNEPDRSPCAEKPCSRFPCL